MKRASRRGGTRLKHVKGGQDCKWRERRERERNFAKVKGGKGREHNDLE